MARPGSDLLGEAEEVELGPQFAMVAPLGFLQLVQIGGQRLLRLPGRPVDPLELRPLLVAPPVGAGHPHQLEMAQPAGRGNVRTPAEIGERVRVPVGADDGPAGIDLVGPRPDRLDDLRLNGWSANNSSPSPRRMLVADEGLVLGHDGAHLGLDPPQVVVAETGAAGQREVVVEAVLDDRADGVLGPRPQAEHGLGQHMGRRVPQHLAPGIGVGGDDGHLGPIDQGGAQVDLHGRRPWPRWPPWPAGDRSTWANSAAVVPSASSRIEPSGSRTEMTPAIVQPFVGQRGISPLRS